MTLLALACLVAQSGVITGQAIDARTGNPVRRAYILATSHDMRQHHTEAGPDGRFAFESLPPGDYLLRGERAGYVRLPVSRRSRGGTRAVVRAGVRNPPVVVKLTPHAALEGVISDEAGDPVQGARVELRRAGGREEIAHDISDDRGEYRLYGLEAGSYRLAARAEGKPLALFPKPILLRAGDDLRAINLSLDRVSLGRVTGHLSEPASIDLIPKLEGGPVHTLHATAAFEIVRVLPGEYWLRAVSDDGKRFALLDVNVNEDLRLPVTLEPGATVRGTVKGATAVLRGMYARQTYDARPDPEGAFEIPNVAPDLYTFHVMPNLPDAYLESIRFNNEPAPREGIAITSSGGELQITVGTKGAEFIVVALDEKYQEAPGAHIVLWSVDPKKSARWIDEFRVGNDAQAAVRGIAPGEYFVVALDDWEPMGAHWDPARLAPLEPHAERVKFGPGERAVRYLRIANPAP